MADKEVKLNKDQFQVTDDGKLVIDQNEITNLINEKSGLDSEPEHGPVTVTIKVD